MPYIPHTPESLLPRSDSKNAEASLLTVVLAVERSRNPLRVLQAQVRDVHRVLKRFAGSIRIKLMLISLRRRKG